MTDTSGYATPTVMSVDLILVKNYIHTKLRAASAHGNARSRAKYEAYLDVLSYIIDNTKGGN
jgi:hypothetical protein